MKTLVKLQHMAAFVAKSGQEMSQESLQLIFIGMGEPSAYGPKFDCFVEYYNNARKESEQEPQA